MSRFGPTRSEYRIRFMVSVAGLAMLAGGVWYRRGAEFGAGAWEAIIIALVFFGGTAAWSLRQLTRRDQ